MLAVLLAPFASAQECLFESRPAELIEATFRLPYQVSYEGAFPETTEGAGITAYLDDGRVTRVMTLEYMGETGRATAVFRFEDAATFTIGFDDYDYEQPIFMDPKAKIARVQTSCFEIRNGRVVRSSPGANPELAAGLLDDLELVLAQYMPFAFQLPPKLPLMGGRPNCAGRGTPPLWIEFEALIRSGRRHLADDDLIAALSDFEMADAIVHHEAPTFEALVHIAESRCRMGDSEAGLAALDDFDCALRAYDGKLPCYFEDPTGATVGIDNPALTPECFERMCGEIFLSYYERKTEEGDVHIATHWKDSERVRTLCADSPRPHWPAGRSPAKAGGNLSRFKRIESFDLPCN